MAGFLLFPGTETGREPIKMLNMKVDPEMYMKTKDRLTQWPIFIRAFVPSWSHFRENGQHSTALLHENASILRKKGERSGTKIGSSDDRPVGLHARFKIQDHPINRCLDHPLAR